MKNHSFNFTKRCAVFLAITALAALSAMAQGTRGGFGGGGFGGFGGFGGGGAGRTGGSGSSSRTYPNNSQIGDVYFSVDADNRRVVVIGDLESLRAVSQVISNLNRPKPQVLIKCVFLEVQLNDSSDIGIEGGFKQNTPSQTVNGANYFGLSGLGSALTNLTVNRFGQPVASFLPTPPGAGLYQISGQNYEATLRLIASSGNARLLSRPSILARNNQPATVSVAQSVPLVTGTRFDNFGNAINTITYTSVGIILRVTPFISDNGMIEMVLSPETSQLADKSQWIPINNGAGASLAPVINASTADTVVVTPNHQTVIIGGMISNFKTQNDSKIPFLGDLPVLGALFRSRAKTAQRQELVIFLTPHVVFSPTELADMTDRERSPMEKDVRKEFGDQEVQRYLEGLQLKGPAPSGATPPAHN